MKVIRVSITEKNNGFILRIQSVDKDGYFTHYEKSGFETVKEALQCAVKKDFT